MELGDLSSALQQAAYEAEKQQRGIIELNGRVAELEYKVENDRDFMNRIAQMIIEYTNGAQPPVKRSAA